MEINNQISIKHVRYIRVLCLLGMVCSYLGALLFATWDRLEMMVPAQAMMVLSLVLLIYYIWREKSVRLDKFDLLVILASCYYYFRAVDSPVSMYGDADAGLITMSLALWLVMRNTMALPKKPYWLVLLALIVISHLIACYYQQNVDKNWGFLRVRSKQAAVAVSGLYGYYNYFANFMAMAGCLMLGFIFSKSTGLIWRYLAVLIFLCASYSVVVTHSRGGLIALGVGSIVFLICMLIVHRIRQQKWNWKLLLSLISGGGVLIAVLGILAANLAEKRGYVEDRGFFHDNGRVNNNIMAIEQIIDGGIMGGGARSYEWKSAEYWLDDIWSRAAIPNYVHNEYLQVMTDYGWIGGFLLISIILAVFYMACKSVILDKDEGVIFPYRIGALCAASGFFVQCLFSFPAHILANLLTMVIIVYFAFRGKKEKRDTSGIIYLMPVSVVVLALIMTLSLSTAKSYPAFIDRFDLVEYERLSSDERINRIDDRLENVNSLVEWNPTFLNLKTKGELHWQKASFAEDENEVQKEMFLAANAYSEAAKRYPWELSLQINAGKALDRCYEFEKATPYFLFAFEHGERMEYWIGARWELANHYYIFGKYLWGKREPEKALSFFLQAEKLMEGQRGQGNIKLFKMVQQHIKFLRNTGIKEN